MDGTIISQGTFIVAAGVPAVRLAIPSNSDWMTVYNYTRSGVVGAGTAPFTNTGVKFYWQRGMAPGMGIAEYYTAAGLAVNRCTMTTGGFTLLDTSDQTPGAGNLVVTGISAANPPVVTTAVTPPLGSIVRFYAAGVFPQAELGGLDLTVTAVNPGVTFTIGNISLIGSGATGANVCGWRLIANDPIYYPRHRSITYVRVAAQAVIYLSVTHQYTVGQRVRLSFPKEAAFRGGLMWGDYCNLDGVECTITAVNVPIAGAEPINAAGNNNIQVDVSTIGFTAWNATFGAGNIAWPLANEVAFTPPSVTPVGMDSGISLTTALPQVPLEFPGVVGGVAPSAAVLGANTGLLADSTINLSYIGMNLGVGGAALPVAANFISGPAGSVAADVMYWVAGKSTFGGL